MKLYFNKYIFCVMLLVLFKHSYAQHKVSVNVGNTDNDNKYEEALVDYNSSLYFESEKLLKEIIKTKFRLNKYHIQDVYELLIKNQLELDEVYQADTTAYKMLHKNPNYELKEENNSEEYNKLINKFDVHPLLTFGIRNVEVLDKIKITKVYSVLPDVDYSVHYAKIGTFFNYFGWMEYQPIKNTGINAEINFCYIYTFRTLSKPGWSLSDQEYMELGEVPLYVRQYIHLSKNVFAYGSLGIDYLRVLQAFGAYSITYTQANIYTGEQTNISYYTGKIDVTKMRTLNNWEWNAGAGLGYKFKNIGLCLDFRYTGGLTSLTNPKARFDNPVLINNYYYIDNSFKLNKYEFGVIISYTIKNSIKKR